MNINDVVRNMAKAKELNEETVKLNIERIDLKAVPVKMQADANAIVTEIKAMMEASKTLRTKAQWIKAKAETMQKSIKAETEAKQAEMSAITDINSPEIDAIGKELNDMQALCRAVDEVSWRAGDVVWSLGWDRMQDMLKVIEQPIETN